MKKGTSRGVVGGFAGEFTLAALAAIAAKIIKEKKALKEKEIIRYDPIKTGNPAQRPRGGERPRGIQTRLESVGDNTVNLRLCE